MAWTKAEREEFHQLDLAVTRLEARIQILTEHVNKLQMHTFAPRPYAQDYTNPNPPTQTGQLPNPFKGFPI